MKFHKTLTHLLISTVLLALGLATYLFLNSHQQVIAQEVTTSATESKILVALAQDVPTWLDDKLFTLDPDGTNLTPIFDFSGQPKLSTGRILGLRVSSDGRYIHFHSTHAFIYTPARRNLFRLDGLGTTLEQVTPGPHSGDFSQTGNSTVSGVVQTGGGAAYIGTSVYLEGMGTINTDGAGSFTFTNVPAGVRWLVAYNTTLDVFEARAINVVTNLNTTGLILVPNTSSRMNFERPVPYGNRIYHIGNSGLDIDWTDVDFAGPTTTYTSPGDACTGIPTVDAFDVSSSGKIVVYDYQTGCGGGNFNHVGLYTMNNDGSNKQILLNMLSDPDWDSPILPVEIFWSPDETKIAVKAGYANFDRLLVYDTNGTLLSFGTANTATEVVTLYGWSPDGTALLFSEYDGDPSQAKLRTIVVNGDGTLGADTTLLNNQPISGATWGNLLVKQNVYLPLVIR